MGLFDETTKELGELKEKYEALEKKLSAQQEEKKDGSGAANNNSLCSDGDDYSSVQEMKEHLKHAR